MARYDESKPYTHDYEDDCAWCGEEFPRGELGWIRDETTVAMLLAFGAIANPHDDTTT